MNDRAAAEAVGLNPDTAAYTKAKPRVRAYMFDHRAAVNEKLVDQEAEGAAASVNPGRDQILNRLWELANLSHESDQGQHRRPGQGSCHDRSHRRPESRTDRHFPIRDATRSPARQGAGLRTLSGAANSSTNL